jgi:pilus assembly protein CpaC
MQASRTQSAGMIPGLGEIPVLGALMRSDNFQRSESELVIVITPYIVRPTSDPKALHGPQGATAAPAGDLQRILLFRQFAGKATPPETIPGDVGFVIR